MKRALSAVLTLCMALPGASVAFGSASAATVSDDSSTSASSTAAGSLVEDDGFTWDNANVYFLLTDRFKNGNTAMTIHTAEHLTRTANRLTAGIQTPVHSTAATLQVLLSQLKRVILITSV